MFADGCRVLQPETPTEMDTRRRPKQPGSTCKMLFCIVAARGTPGKEAAVSGSCYPMKREVQKIHAKAIENKILKLSCATTTDVIGRL